MSDLQDDFRAGALGALGYGAALDAISLTKGDDFLILKVHTLLLYDLWVRCLLILL